MPVLLELLPQDGIRMHRIASTNGGEYVGPCPLCGGVDRFHVWPQEGDGGRRWCRGCEKSGDVIQYLRDVRKLSYLQACLEAGKEPADLKRSFDWGRAANTEREGHGRKWEPREIAPPPCEWIRKCSAFVDWCHEKLLKEATILAYLKDCRGLSEDTIKAFQLGWNPQNLSRGRDLWGLEEKLKEDGSRQDIWLPQGIVIPYFVHGILQRARIRRLDPKGHTPEKGPAYCIVSGSTSAAMVPEEPRKILVVVESEFDAILLQQEAGHLAGMVALGSAQTKPDKRAFEILQAADLILVALDSDDDRDDGKNPGAKEAWGWWLKHFPQARRLPPVDGKDPGEMWLNGVDLRQWIIVGIDKYFPQTQTENHGHAENHEHTEDHGHAANHGQNRNPLDNAVLIQEVASQLLDNQPVAPQQDPAGLAHIPAPMPDQLTTDPDPVSDQSTPDPDFSKAGLIVRLHSDLLNEDFFLVSDRELRDRVEAENQGIVAYLPGEIECLAGLGPEEVKRLHMVKKAFPGGEFISAGNAEDSIFCRIDPSAGRCRGICLPTSSNDDLGNRYQQLGRE